MLESQAKSGKDTEIDSLKKTIERLEVYQREQKNALEKVNQLVETKNKEVETL